jgi:hypothetical protein
MSETKEELFADIRASVQALCAQFPGDYWQKLDEAPRTRQNLSKP